MDRICLIIKALPENESFARSVIAAYATRLNPSMEEISDIKTSVSEAITNAIVHGYNNDPDKDISITASIEGNTLWVTVEDKGVGIPDIVEAMKDFYTTKPSEERSGLGFTIMGSFMDTLQVKSVVGEGTTVIMSKVIS
ncbi:MAG: anti-sigma F factor [Clostridiales bacterium]|jgi:stage II sporulation protein AB (anti-sigma F factor)|nr:anti-sigma F factor [Clostridiales bacterium]HOB64763.1 anti-sigma F factor [Clostridia bacterium]HOK81438.1 anti-sigma F factor [Clostridia bacterium]HOL60738.1 anti-sigma F factor [Clostridia bacterium]HPO53313.1 anti-sigma F factor [Clostridia bacterium]